MIKLVVVRALELSELRYLVVLLLLLLCSENYGKAHVEAHAEAYVRGSEIPWKNSCGSSCRRQQNIAVELLYHS